MRLKILWMTLALLGSSAASANPYYWHEAEMPKTKELDRPAVEDIVRWDEYGQIIKQIAEQKVGVYRGEGGMITGNFISRCNYEGYGTGDCVAFELDVFSRSAGYDVRPPQQAAKLAASLSKYGDYYKGEEEMENPPAANLETTESTSGPDGARKGGGATLFWMVIWYLLPTLIAWGRKHNNFDPILLFNLFFGWTVVCWLIALIWAVNDNVKSPAQRSLK